MYHGDGGHKFTTIHRVIEMPCMGASHVRHNDGCVCVHVYGCVPRTSQ